VQKYEKGANRVGASRLSQIASVLGISVGDLFESSGDLTPVLEFTDPPACRARRFARSQGLCADNQSRVRLSIAKLVESIADRQAAKASVTRLDVVNRGDHGISRARG